jgi:hypothetical protein
VGLPTLRPLFLESVTGPGSHQGGMAGPGVQTPSWGLRVSPRYHKGCKGHFLGQELARAGLRALSPRP